MKNLTVALIAVFALALGWSQSSSACEGKCGKDKAAATEGGAPCGGAEGCGACGKAEGQGCACGKADGKPCDKADCPLKGTGGCAKAAKGECPHKAKAEGGCAHKKAAAAGVPADAVGQEATCPVTGEKFKVTESTPFSVVDGKNVYFCCPGCKPRFDADPAKFITKK